MTAPSRVSPVVASTTCPWNVSAPDREGVKRQTCEQHVKTRIRTWTDRVGMIMTTEPTTGCTTIVFQPRHKLILLTLTSAYDSWCLHRNLGVESRYRRRYRVQSVTAQGPA